MFFSLTGNLKQARSALRDALGVINGTKPEDRRKVADSLATLAENERNPVLAGEILNATKHLRPVIVDPHVLAALVEAMPDALLGRKLEALAVRCLAANDAAGIRLVGAAQRALSDRLAVVESRRREYAGKMALEAVIARRAETRRRNRAADQKRVTVFVTR